MCRVIIVGNLGRAADGDGKSKAAPAPVTRVMWVMRVVPVGAVMPAVPVEAPPDIPKIVGTRAAELALAGYEMRVARIGA
ncbi:MAG: hypothetical protein EON54_17450, partial [Alcaligenaceae bacterium]